MVSPFVLDLTFGSQGTGLPGVGSVRCENLEAGIWKLVLYAPPMHLGDFPWRRRYPGGYSRSPEQGTDMLCYLLDSNYMDTLRSQSICILWLASRSGAGGSPPLETLIKPMRLLTKWGMKFPWVRCYTSDLSTRCLPLVSSFPNQRSEKS